MNRAKRGVTMLLICGLLISLLQVNVQAEENEGTETKVYCNATIEDDFADDRVMVVLNNATSLAIDQNETDSFNGVRCNQVKSLSEAKEARIQEKLCSISAELEEIAVASNLTQIVTTENVMKIAATDEELSSYHQVLCIDLEEGGKDKVLEAIAELEKQEDILYAGPDYVLSVCATTPNDTYYSQQWAADMIDLPETWDITTGSSSISVAVLDTGIEGSHPDLTARINTSMCRDFTSGVGIYKGTPTDDNGHGTAVAGVIGAIGDNTIGIAGTCWNVCLVSLKIMDSSGNGYSSHAAAAIDYADSQNIPIINFSVKWYDDDNNSNDVTDQEENYDYALYTVINNYSGLFVCAAGNEGGDNDLVDARPANYRLPNLITVGSSDKNDLKYSGSNYGVDNVDIFAPGEDIYSTSRGGGYGKYTGTSFATPYVVGVAALLLSKYPYLTAPELKRSILENAEMVYDIYGVDVFVDLCTSGGRLNAYDTLSNPKHTHTYTYVNVSILEGHDYVCTACGNSVRERHTWSTSGSIHSCVKCGVESSYRPYANDTTIEE